MRAYMFADLSDAALVRDLDANVARELIDQAVVLAQIAEVDARRLYLPAGFPSMHAYCVEKLRLSEDVTKKRIRAGRTARRFPAIFPALAEGRLHLSAVVLLSPHLNQQNAGELLAAAEHKSKSDIEQLIAQRFPGSELMTLVEAIPGSTAQSHQPLSHGTVGGVALTGEGAPGPPDGFLFTGQVAPAQVEGPAPRSHMKPRLHYVMIDQSTHDLLRYAQDLASHEIGDASRVLKRALEMLVRHLEKRKFAATNKPRPRSGRSSTNPCHIPANVKRAVWERDRGECTFVSEQGHRCGSRKFIEYDHIDPVARGGQATVENVRLRCRAHNQLEAERTFGAGFISEKREEARRSAEARARAIADEQVRDVTAGLRELGFRADEARLSAEFCKTPHDAALEERMRAALKFLCPKARFHGPNGTSPEVSA